MMLKLTIFAAFLILNVTSFILPFFYNPCPDGEPMVMCSYPPCSVVQDRICNETFCGTCKANCYNSEGAPIECTYIDNWTHF